MRDRYLLIGLRQYIFSESIDLFHAVAWTNKQPETSPRSNATETCIGLHKRTTKSAKIATSMTTLMMVVGDAWMNAESKRLPTAHNNGTTTVKTTSRQCNVS